jgi:phosphatidylserine/phosphatidylglycerophosphate/cardiolipin synthase-like enzyme
MFFNKKNVYLVLFLLFVSALLSFGATKPYKLAVTIPVETTLDNCDTRSALEVWLEMIENAKETINFGEFYITNKKGKALEKVVNKLKEAGERGVKIRFLLDKKMFGNSKPFISDLKRVKNIEIAIFNWKKLTGGVHHAKYFVVDNKMCFIGSQNFDWRALTHIHETGVKIEDIHFANALNAIFEADFDYAQGDKDAYEKLRTKHFTFSDKYFLTGSPKKFLPIGVKYSLDTLISLINSANKKITVQLLNFSKKIYKSKEKFTDISTALENAAKRGVKVNILVSNWNKRKPGVYDLIELSKVNGITVKFVNIPVSKQGFIPFARVIHSKVMRVDDNICWIGTSNWAKGYFSESRNLEVVIKDKDLAKTLDCLFDSLWNSLYCEKVEEGKAYHPPKIY